MTATLEDVTKRKPERSPEEKAAAELVRQAKELGLSLTGPDGFWKQLTKSVIEAALGEEMTDHLGYAKGEAPPEPGNEQAAIKCLYRSPGPLIPPGGAGHDGLWVGSRRSTASPTDSSLPRPTDRNARNTLYGILLILGAVRREWGSGRETTPSQFLVGRLKGELPSRSGLFELALWGAGRALPGDAPLSD